MKKRKKKECNSALIHIVKSGDVKKLETDLVDFGKMDMFKK